jgi:hypothetical protein
MRHSLAAGLIVASTVAAAAQTSSQAPSAISLQSAPKSAKVTGCLAAGPGADTFTLTTVEADLKPNPVGTSGVAGSPESGALKPDVKTVIYTLTPQPGVDLSAHIGHTVEVSGMEPPAKQTATTTDQRRRSRPATLASTTPKTEIVARRMRVSAVKMVAADCHIRK